MLNMNPPFVVQITCAVLTATLVSSLPTSLPSRSDALPITSNSLDYYLRDKLAKNTNAVISSFGIFSAFALIYSATGGTTKTELENALGLNQQSIQGLQNYLQDVYRRNRSVEILDIGNAAFVQRDFRLNQKYVNNLQRNFRAELQNVDFKDRENTKNIINEFISKSTNGLIPNFFKQPLDPATVFELINTIYFKAKWQTPFRKFSTSSSLFKGTKNRQVPFMSKRSVYQYKSDANLNAQVLRLSYIESSAMYVFLPRSHDLEQLYELSRKLTPQVLGEVAESVNYTGLNVQLPKFTIDSDFQNLKDSLKAKGLRAIFSPNANVSGVSDQAGLLLSDVQHRGKIIVDEEGTEASAVTSLGFVPLSGVIVQEKFIADHPFLFIIRDESSGVVLFSGFVVDP